LGGAASEIFNTNVHAFRRACGENLAEVDIEHGFIPDIIVPIRDSGAAATEGYSMKFIEHLARAGYSPEEIGARIPREALLRNNSVQRTFILPKGRGSAVTEKFTIIPDVVRGKKVVLIDDSVVRGNTMTHLIQMLLDEGASEVHVRSASPPVRHGCYYGVDFSGSDQELIAVGKTEQQIAEIIGAHSIAYINLQDMVGIAKTMSGRENDFCTACFDGNYPVAVNPDLLLGKAC
jgi:amidophosphoribosyltransferase